MLVLTVAAGPDPGRNLELQGDRPLIFGRFSLIGDEVDPKLSRRHALFRREGHRWLVQDLGSRNGTFVNGRPIDHPTVLKTGDEIRMGRTVLTVALLGEDALAAPGMAPAPGMAITPTDGDESEPGITPAPTREPPVAVGAASEDASLDAPPAAGDREPSSEVEVSAELDTASASPTNQVAESMAEEPGSFVEEPIGSSRPETPLHRSTPVQPSGDFLEELESADAVLDERQRAPAEVQSDLTLAGERVQDVSPPDDPQAVSAEAVSVQAQTFEEDVTDLSQIERTLDQAEVLEPEALAGLEADDANRVASAAGSDRPGESTSPPLDDQQESGQARGEPQTEAADRVRRRRRGRVARYVVLGVLLLAGGLAAAVLLPSLGDSPRQAKVPPTASPPVEEPVRPSPPTDTMASRPPTLQPEPSVATRSAVPTSPSPPAPIPARPDSASLDSAGADPVGSAAAAQTRPEPSSSPAASTATPEVPVPTGSLARDTQSAPWTVPPPSEVEPAGPAALDPYRTVDTFSSAMTSHSRVTLPERTSSPPPSPASKMGVPPASPAPADRQQEAAPPSGHAAAIPGVPDLPLPPPVVALRVPSETQTAVSGDRVPEEPEPLRPRRHRADRPRVRPAPIDDADRIVFVVDASGSMIDTLPLVIQELERMIGQLHSDQRFTVLFYHKDRVIEVEPTGMKEATRRNKVLVSRWMDPRTGHIFAVGPSYPLAAIQAALNYQPDQIFLLADKIGVSMRAREQTQQFLKELALINPDKKVQINAVHFFYPDPHQALASVASGHDGTYRFVSLDDVANESSRGGDPLRDNLMILLDGQQ